MYGAAHLYIILFPFRNLLLRYLFGQQNISEKIMPALRAFGLRGLSYFYHNAGAMRLWLFQAYYSVIRKLSSPLIWLFRVARQTPFRRIALTM